ncbi:MAG: folate family ECF transporter S component [Oscillospiraceae bacterium]|nr:folate family ECF transporter S component [Oscillospiraceae bacterium]
MNKNRFSTKMLATLSILVAMEVIIARFGTIRPTESIKISLDFIPIVVAAILYGPVPAVIMSILADVLGAFLFPVGPFFPGFTLTAAVTGLIYGLLLNKKQTMPHVVLPVVLQQGVCSMLINTFWLHVLYSLPYLPTMAARLVQCAVVTALQIVVIPLIAKTILSVQKRLPA